MTLGIFIPGRLASERLPNKLLLSLGNSCLWEIACQKLEAMSRFSNVYALTCDKELISIAEKYPNIKIILRSKESSSVDGPLTCTFGGVSHMRDSHLMFLNPCLAFLTQKTIETSHAKFQWSGAHDYATSIKPFRNWLFNAQGESISPIDYKELNTKDIPNMYQAAHCFHIFNRKRFLEDGQMLKSGHLLLPVPEEETTDVDTLEDYKYARWKWENDI